MINGNCCFLFERGKDGGKFTKCVSIQNSMRLRIKAVKRNVPRSLRPEVNWMLRGPLLSNIQYGQVFCDLDHMQDKMEI